jgi:F0F1-type ATP synthase assembly protein I
VTTSPERLKALDAPPVERQVAADMIRRALPVAPVLVVVAAVVWGLDGGLSALYGLAIVLANFALAAAMLSWAGRRSVGLLMGVALFGYLLRLGLVAGAVLAVKDQGWVDLLPLGLTIVITHLGLLFWETSRVSASLAFPSLKPQQGSA